MPWAKLGTQRYKNCVCSYCKFLFCSFLTQHFVCAHCEKAFEGRRHFEKKGLAYCERDYKFVSVCLCVCRESSLLELYVLCFMTLFLSLCSSLVMCASLATNLVGVMVSVCGVWVCESVYCSLYSCECAQQELVCSALSLHCLWLSSGYLKVCSDSLFILAISDDDALCMCLHVACLNVLH